MDGVEKVFDTNKQDSYSLIDYQLMDRNENNQMAVDQDELKGKVHFFYSLKRNIDQSIPD